MKKTMLSKKIRLPLLVILAVVEVAALIYLLWLKHHFHKVEIISGPPQVERKASPEPPTFKKAMSEEEIKKLPSPVSMDRLKAQGCVADGLLTEYHPENDRFVELINRSNCYYLHRAVETWLSPPDFSTIEEVMKKINKKEVVYGMFIAEAINTKAKYFNEKKERNFYFNRMCHKEKRNRWGEHACVPTLSSREYRDYIKYITRKAMDLGIQSFTFGQIYMQEGSRRNYARRVVKDIRDYAEKIGLDVIVGAQTGSITDEKYLKMFDYIEGGVGIDSSGNVEDGPCFSRKSGCWALLWHPKFSKKAKNVLLHLDWSGIPSDDLDIFARMNRKQRADTLFQLYKFFNERDMGFMMPYFGVLHRQNGGCYGPKKRFYSPDNAYLCKDEEVINQILAQAKD